MEENTLVSIKVELRSSLQNIKVKNSKVFCEFVVNVSAKLKKIIWLFWLHFGWLPWKYPFHLPNENQKHNKKAPPSPLGVKSMVCRVKWNFIILQHSHILSVICLVKFYKLMKEGNFMYRISILVTLILKLRNFLLILPLRSITSFAEGLELVPSEFLTSHL